MITYNEQNRTFQLDGKNFSYVIGVFHEKANYLVHLYCGKKIPQGEDLYDMLFRGYHASFIPENKELYDDGCHWFYPANAPMEYPTEGAGDFRSAALAVRNKDGNAVCPTDPASLGSHAGDLDANDIVFFHRILRYEKIKFL